VTPERIVAYLDARLAQVKAPIGGRNSEICGKGRPARSSSPAPTARSAAAARSIRAESRGSR
jgi:hypothetical protein